MRRIFCADRRILNFCDVLTFREICRWLCVESENAEYAHLTNGHLVFWDRFGHDRGYRQNPFAEDILKNTVEVFAPWCVFGDIVVAPMADYFPDSMHEESALRL